MANKIEKFLVLAFLVFLPSQLGFHWWPRWSLVSGVRVDYLSPTLFFSDLLIFALLGFSFVRRLIKLPKLTPLFVLVAIINIFLSISPLVSLFAWIRLGELFLLGIYFYYRLAEQRIVVGAGLMVALIWSSVLAVVQFIFQSSLGGPLYFLGERNFSVSTLNIARLDLGQYGYWLRAYATLPHPNALAGFLLVGTLLVFYLLPKTTRWWTAPVCLAIILTWSRSVFVVTGLLLFAPLAPVLLLLPGNPASLLTRWDLNLVALKAFTQHPLTGVGYGTFVGYLNGASFQPVHNIFLLILSELGPVVFLAIMWWLAKTIITLIKTKQYLLLKTVCAVLVIGLVDHYWLTLHQTSLLITILLAQVAVKSKNL